MNMPTTMPEKPMLKFIALACQHLDTVATTGQVDRDTAAAIYAVLRKFQAYQGALQIAKEALTELQLPCTHDEHDPNYRPLSDSRGWCSTCQAKVMYREDTARDALKAIEGELSYESGSDRGRGSR